MYIVHGLKYDINFNKHKKQTILKKRNISTVLLMSLFTTWTMHYSTYIARPKISALYLCNTIIFFTYFPIYDNNINTQAFYIHATP